MVVRRVVLLVVSSAARRVGKTDGLLVVWRAAWRVALLVDS